MFIFCPFDFLFGHIINILLTELGRSVWKNLGLGRWYRPHCVRSVLATSVKILPYRPPARLIRTKLCDYYSQVAVNLVINRKLLTLGEKRIAKQIAIDWPPLQKKIQTQTELFMRLAVE